jgi:8-oxo-dGTP pyrophosphatase MutT (NUDIX family)
MAKTKAQIPPWFFEQSGVIPFRRHGRGVEILLITSARKKRWILPKGVVEPGMTARASARKEAREEAGIEGNLLTEAVGEYVFDKWNGACRVQMFAMNVTDVHEHWDEEHLRKRKWVNLQSAQSLIDNKDLRTMLLRFAANLDYYLG